MARGVGGVWSGVTIDCVDPEVLCRFWEAVLGYERKETLPGWTRLAGPSAGVPDLNFQPVAEPKAGKVRTHLDVTVKDVEAGIRLVVELGGHETGERHEYDEGVVVVMADPEGNEFCLVEYAG